MGSLVSLLGCTNRQKLLARGHSSTNHERVKDTASQTEGHCLLVSNCLF